MAYQKQEWIDRVIDPVQIDPETGKLKVVQEGTRFTSTRANHFEQGIADAHSLVESLAKEWGGNFVAAPSGTAGLQFSASGLTANWTSGIAYVGGLRFDVTAGNMPLNATQGQYIYLDVDGVVKNTTTQATANAALPLWYFATDASQVITSIDQRNTLNFDALIADQTMALPTSDQTGKLRQWLSWFANMITKITGKAKWWQTPSTTLEAANAHMNATTGVHGATSADTANTLTQRDANGDMSTRQFKSTATTGTAPFSVLSTTVVTNLCADLLDGYHASSSGTGNTIALRDSSGSLTVKQLWTTATTGTSPLVVSSTTKVTNLNVDQVDGYDANTGTTANTIPVRDSVGKVPGSITGDAATVGGKSLTDIVATAQTFGNFDVAYNAVADSLDFRDKTTGNIVKRLYRDGNLKIVGQIQEVTVIKIGQDIVCTEDMTTGALINVTGAGTSLSLAQTGGVYASSGNRVQTYDLTSVKLAATTKLSWTQDLGKLPMTYDYTTPINVANSGYTTNEHARPQKLSNGWIITVSRDASHIYVHVLKDPAGTYELLTTATISGTMQDVAVASNGTQVYIVASISSTVNSALLGMFDAVNVTSTFTLNKGTVTGLTLIGGCSICIGDDGTIHVVASGTDSGYVNSYNIRYTKSTDNGATFISPVMFTSDNTANIHSVNPVICMANTNTVICAYTKQIGSGVYGIRSRTYNGTTLGNEIVIQSGVSYQHDNPSIVKDSAGVIHTVWWGVDGTDPNWNHVRYSKSLDVGATWSAPVKLTSGTTRFSAWPSITADKNNNLFVLCATSTTSIHNIGKIACTNGTWGAIVQLTNYTTGTTTRPTTIENSRDFTEPLTAWQDSQNGAIKFYGKFTAISNNPAGTITLETSIDNGATWQTATNGTTIPGIATDMDVKGKTLKVRQTITTNNTSVSPTISNVKLELYSKAG
ncbi:hypothetical protein DFP93_103206 [Aneurinibacillus soli]|uniref:Uncharacterized protein n=1 Tax=Aneurinibacillus soli TaxID=1500254 RepID=A0A0U5C945_9BACL|nr:sialidase family protein [Aneurinibacillus soli]PYE62994.1 hypothetical protein DFP93_103206 [Aneurinibacillus soli]BAU28947.1 hypothetical protein CB4_03124 [Aneurinibacillus soli]